MRREFLIIVAAVIVVIAALALVISPLLFGPASAEINAVTTDNDLYHSNEIMKITVVVRSQGDMSNTTLTLSGIQDRHGSPHLMREIPINLSPGLNTLVYEHRLPSCSSCSGLNPGTYAIEAALVREGEIVSNMTHSFSLEQ